MAHLSLIFVILTVQRGFCPLQLLWFDSVCNRMGLFNRLIQVNFIGEGINLCHCFLTTTGFCLLQLAFVSCLELVKV